MPRRRRRRFFLTGGAGLYLQEQNNCIRLIDILVRCLKSWIC